MNLVTVLAGNVEQVMASDNEGNGSFIRARSFGSFKHEFRLEDACSFIKDGLGVSEIDHLLPLFFAFHDVVYLAPRGGMMSWSVKVVATISLNFLCKLLAVSKMSCTAYFLCDYFTVVLILFLAVNYIWCPPQYNFC